MSNIKKPLSKKLLKAALASYETHKGHVRVKKPNILGIIDMGLHSKYRRFYVIDVKTKKVIRQHHVAHGRGSDPSYSGIVQRFSSSLPVWRRDGSKRSPQGMLVTGKTYNWRPCRFPTCTRLKLHGLESRNKTVFRRAVVIHSSKYVTDAFINSRGRAGMSWGCPAVDPAIADSLIDMLKNGALVYINSRSMV